jgi:hypothetical protein
MSNGTKLRLIGTWLGERPDAAKFRIVVTSLVLAGLLAAAGLLLGLRGVSGAVLGSLVLVYCCFPETTLRVIEAAYKSIPNLLEEALQWSIAGVIVAVAVVLFAGGLLAPEVGYFDIVSRILTYGLSLVLVLYGASSAIKSIRDGSAPLRTTRELPTAEDAQVEADELLLIEWNKQRGQMP